MKTVLLAALLSLAVVGPGWANPGLGGSGLVKVVFAFKDAADTSELRQVGQSGVLFNNQRDAPGATVTLGSAFGTMQFRLDDLTTGVSFLNDEADTGFGGDGRMHARYGRSAADFGVTFSAAANAAISDLGPNVTFVGFEDRRLGDYDYNDLIFAFSNIQAVPEPSSLGILGAALLGVLAACRRARRSTAPSAAAGRSASASPRR